MRKFTLIITLLALILLLAACSDPEPTPFPATETPSIEPTNIPATKPPLEEVATAVPPTELPPTMTPLPTLVPVPTATVNSISHSPDPMLTNKTWEWIRRDPKGNQMDEIIISNPENYTLVFNDDGSFQAKLDCNENNGRYTIDNPGSIFMELDAATLAACGEDSLDKQMEMMFGPAQNYYFQMYGNVLALTWVAGGPIDYFRNAESDPLSPGLTNKTWQWTSLESYIIDISIDEPEKYLVQFNENNTVNIQADCNLVEATYLSAGNLLNIYLNPPTTPATLADCPDDPLGEFYLLSLDTIQEFTRLDSELLLTIGEQGNNAAVMYFSEVGTEIAEPDEERDETEATQPVQPAPETDDGTGTVNAPDGVNMRIGPGPTYPIVGIIADGTVLTIVGVSQDREWWVVENPEATEEQVWVSRNFVETNTAANDVPTIADPEIEPTLLDNPWQWVSLTTPVETTAVSDQTLYTIQFNADGTAALRADCNTLAASYTTDENAINISTGATTLVACPDESLDALYLNNLTKVTTYFFEAGDLYLELPADSGTMRFAPDKPPVAEQPEEPTTPEEATPTPPEAEGDFFQVTSFGAAGSEQDVLAGTEITAVFNETELTGNAGCNDYSGTLTRTEDTFIVSNLTSTQQTCAEPAGIMEQEQAYLTALADVGAFSWEERLSDDGSKIVTVGQLFYVSGGNGIINLITP